MKMFTEAQLREFTKKCVTAGFEMSGEGWNGDITGDPQYLSEKIAEETETLMRTV